MLEITSHSPEQTRRVGTLVGKLLQPGDVVCLYGDLGAGKTHFSQGVAAGLGVTGRVTSPTFTLINEYQGRCPLYHMDVYRLSGPEEMEDLGYEEYFYGDGVVLIEWPEKISAVLPDERLELKIVSPGENERLLVFTANGEKYHHIIEELSKIVCTGD